MRHEVAVVKRRLPPALFPVSPSGTRYCATAETRQKTGTAADSSSHYAQHRQTRENTQRKYSLFLVHQESGPQ